MARLKLFSRRDKAAMKKLRDKTTPSPVEVRKRIEERRDCPNCNAGGVTGNFCYDCGSNLQSNL